MDLEEQAGFGGHGSPVVAGMGPVGGADLPEDCAALPHHVGDSERAADLHQFTPGNHRFLAGRQGGKGKQDRSRVVVDDQRRFGAGQFAQKPLHVGITASPHPLLQVEFQVGIAEGDVVQGLPDRFR